MRFLISLIFLFFTFAKVQAEDKKKHKEVVAYAFQQVPAEIWRIIFQDFHLIELVKISRVNRYFYNLVLYYLFTEKELEFIFPGKSLAKEVTDEYHQFQALRKFLILWSDFIGGDPHPLNSENLKKLKSEIDKIKVEFKKDSFAFYVQKAVLNSIENQRESEVFEYLELQKRKGKGSCIVKMEDVLSIVQVDILSICYRSGLGVQKDPCEAEKYEKKVREVYLSRQIEKLPFFLMERIRFFLKEKLRKLKEGVTIEKKRELLKFMQFCVRSKSKNLVQFVKEWCDQEEEYIKNLLCDFFNPVKTSFSVFENLKIAEACVILRLNFISKWLKESCQEQLKSFFKYWGKFDKESIFEILKIIQSYLQLKKALLSQLNTNFELNIEIIYTELNSEEWQRKLTHIFDNSENEDEANLVKIQIAQLYMGIKKDLETDFNPDLFQKFFNNASNIQDWLNLRQELVITESLKNLNDNFNQRQGLDHEMLDSIMECSLKSQIEELKIKLEEWMKGFLSGNQNVLWKLIVAFQYWKFFNKREIIFENQKFQSEVQLFLKIDEPCLIEIAKLQEKIHYLNNGSFNSQLEAERKALIMQFTDKVKPLSNQGFAVSLCSYLGMTQHSIEWLKKIEESFKNLKDSIKENARTNNFIVYLITMVSCLNSEALPNDDLIQCWKEWWLSEKTQSDLMKLFCKKKGPLQLNLEQLAFLYSRTL